MANILSALASGRGHGNGKRNSKSIKFGTGFSLFKDFLINSVFFVALVGFSISSSTALPHHVPTEVLYSNGNLRLELMLSPEDTLEMLQLLTTLDQRMKFRQDLLKQNRNKKVGPGAMVRIAKKPSGTAFSRLPKSSRVNFDYEDFPEGVPFLHAVTNENRGIYESPKKRYLGIDIPDYISSGGGASDAIRSMSSKLKALGKRRRR